MQNLRLNFNTSTSKSRQQKLSVSDQTIISTVDVKHVPQSNSQRSSVRELKSEYGKQNIVPLKEQFKQLTDKLLELISDANDKEESKRDILELKSTIETTKETINQVENQKLTVTDDKLLHQLLDKRYETVANQIDQLSKRVDCLSAKVDQLNTRDLESLVPNEWKETIESIKNKFKPNHLIVCPVTTLTKGSTTVPISYVENPLKSVGVLGEHMIWSHELVKVDDKVECYLPLPSDVTRQDINVEISFYTKRGAGSFAFNLVSTMINNKCVFNSKSGDIVIDSKDDLTYYTASIPLTVSKGGCYIAINRTVDKFVGPIFITGLSFSLKA